jgi:hypothetical protein
MMILPSSPGPDTTECVCEPRQVCTALTCTGRARSLMSKTRRPRNRSALTSSLTPPSPQSTRPRVSSTDMIRRSPTMETSPWPPGQTTELNSSGRPPSCSRYKLKVVAAHDHPCKGQVGVELETVLVLLIPSRPSGVLITVGRHGVLVLPGRVNPPTGCAAPSAGLRRSEKPGGRDSDARFHVREPGQPL